MPSAMLAGEIKRWALDIGFDLVGIAPADAGYDLEFARQWVERGFAGKMEYLANPKRSDLRLVFPSAKSVICVGLIYNTEHPYSTEVCGPEGSRQAVDGSGHRAEASKQIAAEEDSPRAWISRYAWGEDYHDIVRAKLEKLREAIETLAPGTETRVFVDTGPVVERAFARFSGIGWMGKSTCLINEGKGSWFFLGVILTNLELSADLPAPDRCGSCTACLEACPTHALVEPYVMDASRCISYLTIELKGSLPEEHRAAMGASIFGCDICQDVCPWNSKGRSQASEVRSRETSFQPMTVSLQRVFGEGETPSMNPPEDCEQGLADGTQFSLFNPPLEALASLTEEEFHLLFTYSPIKRAKYQGWLRNLCVAMGNSGDPRFIPRLEELSQYPDPVISAHAAWALKRLGE
jgi:epoxyqueuosine reductase